jgi:hypothetical protein
MGFLLLVAASAGCIFIRYLWGFFQDVSAQLIKAVFYFQHLLLKPKKYICRLNLIEHISAELFILK